FLTTEANVGYKRYVVNESGESALYGVPFREENLAEKDIESVLNNERYHGMRDLPNETLVTGIVSDEMANTVSVPFTYDNEQYALLLRPNIKMLFTEIHYLLGGLFIVMAVVSLIAMLFIARKLIQPITALTAA